MKQLRLEVVYEWGLLAVLLLIVVHAPLVVGLGNLYPEFAMPIKAWKEIILAVLAVIGAVLAVRHGVGKVLLTNRLIILAALFTGLHLGLAAFNNHDFPTTVAGLLIDLRFIGMFVLMYLLILIRPEAMGRVIRTVALGAAIVIGFGLLQITVLPDDILTHIGYSDSTIRAYTTIDRNPDFVRINSTLRGPNPLGALMVVYLALIVAYLARRPITAAWKRSAGILVAILGSVAVLFASFSRSAYIAVVAALVAVALVHRRISRRGAAIAGGVLVVLVAGLVAVSSTAWFSNVVLHVNPDSTVVSKSDSGHAASIRTGAERLISQPFGGGIGSTGSASLYDTDTSNDFIVENQYFFVAHESGWLGLLLFVMLLVGTFLELYRRRASWVALGIFAGGIGLAIIGLLLPVWTDDTTAIVWWGLAGAAIAARPRIIRGTK
jgi:hypothetical protein